MIIWTFPIPAHGGSDPGAINGNVYEKDFNLKASKYMYDRLRELGIPAQLTRDTDISLPKDERIAKVKSLYGNDPNVILVSNHINSGGHTWLSYGLNL